MSRTNSFFRGMLSVTAQKLLTKIIGLLVTPIVLSYLSSSEYGVWLILASILGYLGLMDFGVTGASGALISKSNNKAEEKHINIIINNAFFLQCLIALAMFILAVLVSSYFPQAINLDDVPETTATKVFILAVFGYTISLPSRVLKNVIHSRQMIALSVWLEFVVFIATTLLNLYLLGEGFGLISLPLGTIAIRLLSYPVFFLCAKKAYPSIYFDKNLVRVSEVKRLVNVSAYWFISTLCAVVIYSTDTLMIGILLNSALVTNYVLTYRLTEVFRELSYSITKTLMPSVGQLLGRGDLIKVKRIYLQSQPVILSMAGAGALLIFQFNESFVKYWVGENYYSGSYLTSIFSVIFFTSVVFHSSSLVLAANLDMKKITNVRLVEAFLNIILSILLIKSYGLLGIALATLIASVSTSFVLIPLYAMRLLSISLVEWFKSVFIRVALVFLVCTLVTIFISQYFTSALFELGLSLMCFTLVSSISIWFISFDKDLREKLYGKYSRK